MFETDVVIVGAGVIGLAIARELSMAGQEVIVLEAEGAIGCHTSSRNSEVIHAGIYYPQDSLKSRLCIEGRNQLYAYCASHHVPFNQCGKLIVAVDAAETQELERLLEMGRRNGVEDLHAISREETHQLEPEIRCHTALASPSTGIIDSHAYMLALQGEAEDHGANIAFHTPFLRAECLASGFRIDVAGTEPLSFQANTLINAAGLFASHVAERIDGLAPAHIRRTGWAKGTYFTLAGRAPFKRLIYPIPEPDGLGVHLTLDLGGQARFGPDVTWIDRIDYTVDEARCGAFAQAIQRYWPELEPGRLQPGYTGIRPKLSGADAPAADFVLDGPETHGTPGLLNLFGIESPGLTASLAIAAHAAAALAAR